MHRAAAAAVLPRLHDLRRPPKVLLWGVAGVAVLVIALLALRDSSLVRVKQVSVTGLSGPDAPAMRTALTEAARDMTTLHVRADQLRTVLEPYPAVLDVSVSRDFPHGLRIVVRQRTPIAIAVRGTTTVPIAADGTLLPSSSLVDLPQVPVRVTPSGARLADRRALAAVTALAAAPPALRDRVTRATWTSTSGLVLDLFKGPQLRFGAPDRFAAKWAAAAAVLTAPSSAGATYLDVRYPEQPAAGGLEDATKQLDPTTANSAAAPGQAPGIVPGQDAAPSTARTPGG
jgi:cell division protein FtsQ